MSRADRRKQGQRGQKETSAKPKLDASNVTLRDLRFDTPDASEMFLNLRYLDDAYKGSRDNGVRLPPLDESVSTTPSSGGMVYKAFPHGLMYGDQLSLMGGMGLFAGLLAALPSIWGKIFGLSSLYSHLYEIATSGGVGGALIGLLFFIMGLVIVPLVGILFLGDLIGYRFQSSALFDRKAGKVHLFSDQSMPWKPWKYTIKSYDWRCIRAEIDTMSTFSGSWGRTEAGLRCVVMDRPGGKEVIDQFVVGINVPANCIQPLLDTWEHVRRFMQHEGPLFANQDDKPNSGLGRQSLWQHLLAWPKLEVVTTIDLFKIGWEDKSLMTLFVAATGIILIPFLWIPMLFGVLPWISGLAKRNPVWPAEIIASVGGNALRGKELDAWRGVVAEKAHGALGVEIRKELT